MVCEKLLPRFRKAKRRAAGKIIFISEAIQALEEMKEEVEAENVAVKVRHETDALEADRLITGTCVEDNARDEVPVVRRSRSGRKRLRLQGDQHESMDAKRVRRV